jgi:biotin synthase
MMLPEEKLASIAEGKEAVLNRDDLVEILDGDPAMDNALVRAGAAVLKRTLGNSVYLRGIVEISNACQKNCFYCGLRRDSSSVARYSMPFDEITGTLRRGYDSGLRSFLLQSGELLGGAHIDTVVDVLKWMKDRYGSSVRMVLCLGELPKGVLKRLREAGGDRYLLRIEASDQQLYMKLHPRNSIHRYSSRLKCLEDLRETGWQVGTGVLIGVPWQDEENLANDLQFMERMDIDMCGMGPYLEHEDTPFWEKRSLVPTKDRRYRLSIRMIALLRILMPDINIAATTALQTINPSGLERGLTAGANVFMPNLTPLKYRRNYKLYEGKVEVHDTLEEVVDKMVVRCKAIGRPVDLDDPGDPRHYLRRTGLA